ncbi:MAG: cytochrome c [Pirellulaceae bacterium]|nr:MAG: cytochrome c [Pirellulaceae bacterium]
MAGKRDRDATYLLRWQVVWLLPVAWMGQPVYLARSEEKAVDFVRDIAPILEEKCLRCHQPPDPKGGVSLVTSHDLRESGFLVAGDPDGSYVLELVSRVEGQRPRMPKEGAPLDDEQIRRLRQWIAQGAVWPDQVRLQNKRRAGLDWWSLQPLAKPSPPQVEEKIGSRLTDHPWLQEWLRHPIDRFVLDRLLQQGLLPSPPADRRTLIRRVTLDLTGLPPTCDQVEAFLADKAADAYERLVDRLLASPAYGERWGRHWLDVVRFGESNGFERNVLINDLWPFRDYVIRSWNSDKPFDRMLVEHLAGDVVGRGDPWTEIGTAFLVCGPYDNVGNQDPVQAAIIRANTVDEILRAVGETFLGFTIGCARCHDHKFDPITQHDYYAWYATFAGVLHGNRPWAAPETIQQHERLVAERAKRRDELRRRLDSLKSSIERRASEKEPLYAATWKRPAPSRTGTEEVFSPVEAQWVRLVVESLDTNAGARVGYRLDEFEVWTDEPVPRNVALRSAGAVAQGKSREAEDFRGAYGVHLVNDGRFGQRWIAQSPELVIRLARPERISRIVFSSDRTAEAGQLPEATFIGEYRIEVSLDGEHWTLAASSADRQPVSDAHRRRRLFEMEITPEERAQLDEIASELAEAEAELAAVPPLPTAWMGRFSQPPPDLRVMLRGDPQQPGDPVVPASLGMLDPLVPPYRLAADVAESERRLRLARWLVDPRNPLVARVLANRLWHYHFGRGLVDTPSDFGFMGGQPSHPELLDWLALEIQRGQWELKRIHRLIVTSQAYRQSSRLADRVVTDADPIAVDADARLLWRFVPRRLEAEAVRDSMLAIAGCLDTRMGGPGFRLYRYLEDNVATYVPLDRPGPDTYRRSVYHQNARAARVDLLTDFDCPDSALPAPRRESTVSPLQALTLLNHAFTLRYG